MSKLTQALDAVMKYGTLKQREIIVQVRKSSLNFVRGGVSGSGGCAVTDPPATQIKIDSQIMNETEAMGELTIHINPITERNNVSLEGTVVHETGHAYHQSLVMKKHIQKTLLFIVLLVAASGISCEKTASVQSLDVMSPETSPTVVPKENRDEEYLVHYREGMKIMFASNAPDSQLKAIEEFKKAAEIKPGDTESYRRISEAYISIDKYEEAANYLHKIIELNSDDGYAQLGLAQILIEHLDKFEEGLQYADAAEKLYESESAAAVINRLKGKAYDGIGNYKEAVKYYRKFLKVIDSTYATEHIEKKRRVSDLEKIMQDANTEKN